MSSIAFGRGDAITDSVTRQVRRRLQVEDAHGGLEGKLIENCLCILVTRLVGVE